VGKLALQRRTILDFNLARDGGVAVVSAGLHAGHLIFAPD